MKVVYTRDALRDLDEILGFIDANYPALCVGIRSSIEHDRAADRALAEKRARGQQRPGVRIVPFIRYPYRLFYRIGEDAVEILYIHHAARLDR